VTDIVRLQKFDPMGGRRKREVKSEGDRGALSAQLQRDSLNRIRGYVVSELSEQ
jgi:hypothetical protein